MCDHTDLSGAATRMQVIVPKSLHDELFAVLGEAELNAAVVDSLGETLRKVRFKRDLDRAAQDRRV